MIFHFAGGSFLKKWATPFICRVWTWQNAWFSLRKGGNNGIPGSFLCLVIMGMVSFREPNIYMNVLWHWLLPQKFGDSQRSPNCSGDLASVHSIRWMIVIGCVVKHIRVLAIFWCSFLLKLVCLKLLRFHMLVCLFSVNGCETVGIFYLLQRKHGLTVELVSCFCLSITSSYADVCAITWWRKSSTSWYIRWMLSQGCCLSSAVGSFWRCR